MIDYSRFSKEKFSPIDKPEKNCWINVINPTKEELEKLNAIIALPAEVLLSLQDKEEMPTLDELDKHIFILLRTPNKISELRYATVPLGIILTQEYIITLCFHKNDVIERFKLHFSASSKNELMLKLLLTSSKVYLSYLNEINTTIDHLENQVYKSQKNKEITKLLGLEQSLVYFNTSLELNKILLSKIGSNPKFNTKKETRKIIGWIEEETRQAISMTKIYTNILSNLMDAFASLISNNLNIVMKLLTTITIIIAVPTLIASYYGMNVSLPFQNSHYAFTMILLMSLFFSGLLLVFFFKSEMI